MDQSEHHAESNDKARGVNDVHLRQTSQLSMSQAMVNSYQLYIQSPPPNNIPVYYDQENDDSGGNKKRRTNYKNPENSAKLSAAINMLLNQVEDSNGLKDIKAISKMFNIPYNTLRDNFLRVTTGQAPKSKRGKKPSSRDTRDSQAAPNPFNYPGMPTLDQIQYMQQLYGILPPPFIPNPAFPQYPLGIHPARQILESTYHSSSNGNGNNSMTSNAPFGSSNGATSAAQNESASSLKRKFAGGNQDGNSSDSGDDDDDALGWTGNEISNMNGPTKKK